MIPVILIFILLVLIAIDIWLKNTRTARLLRRIPGPAEWPIIGNLPALSISREKMWTSFRNWAEVYYPIYKVNLLNCYMINIADPDDAEILLTNTQNLSKSFMYEYIHPWLGTGLLTSTGNKWRKRRRILTPAFHFNVLKKYCDIMIENGEKTVELLKSSDKSETDLISFVSRHTLNVVCEAAMGISLQGREDEENKYRKAVHDMGELLIYRFSRPWLLCNWLYNRTSEGKKEKEILNTLHEFTEKIISDRKEYHEKTGGRYLQELESNPDVQGESSNERNLGFQKKRLAMLDLLIAANKNGEQIDDIGIREEVDTFMFEGHDTSAMGLVFSLLLIAENTDVQKRIREEVKEVLRNSSGEMGYHEIQQMNYLERCIKESMRLFPSVPYTHRLISEDLQLKDHLIPKGCVISLHIIEINRNRRYWSDPLKFDPDRFLPERIQGRHPFSYIPFSAGPRNCIGQKFAMLELKALVAQLVLHFHLEPIDYAHKIPIMTDMVIRPARPVFMKFVPIEK